jgi:CheY-like chemotaxis protein
MAMRVLLIDDVADLVESTAALIELLEDGWQIEKETDATRALATAASFAPDVVLLDVAMPGIDGLQLARDLRVAHGEPLVIVAYTGMSFCRNELAARARELFDAVVLKPAAIDELLHSITVAAHRRKSPRATA